MTGPLSPDRILALTRRHESTAVNTFAGPSDPPVPVRGFGSRLYDATGRSWLDLVCGSAVSNLGHGHPWLADAMRSQIDTGIFHTGTRLPSAARAALYEALAGRVPQSLQRIHLLNSGAEAIETAIKAAQYATGRRRILAFRGGYHGRTLGALSVTAAEKLRQPFLPLCPEVRFLEYPAPTAWPLPDAPDSLTHDETEVLHAVASAGEGGIRDDRPSMLLLEAVQGVSGVHVLRPVFLRALRALCEERGILFVVDEIWNGFGRTGHWFAYEASEVTPDLVVIGKALSGALPLAAVLGSDALLGRWPPGTHTSTFQGNPIACAAATATLEVLQEERLVERARGALAMQMRTALEPLLAHPAVRAIRVVGALAGIELRDTPEQAAPVLARRVQDLALANGVLIYTGGHRGEVVMLVPPLVIARDELDCALQVVLDSLRSAQSA